MPVLDVLGKVCAPNLTGVGSRMSSPLLRYREELAVRGFSEDAAQRAAVDLLERLHGKLSEREARYQRRGWLRRQLRRSVADTRNPPVKGVYFWGGVGRGKTWLVDLFFEKIGRAHV